MDAGLVLVQLAGGGLLAEAGQARHKNQTKPWGKYQCDDPIHPFIAQHFVDVTVFANPARIQQEYWIQWAETVQQTIR